MRIYIVKENNVGSTVCEISSQRSLLLYKDCIKWIGEYLQMSSYLILFRWLLATGKYEECTKTLANIIAFNKKGNIYFIISPSLFDWLTDFNKLCFQHFLSNKINI